jgi:hypothetical protein
MMELDSEVFDSTVDFLETCKKCIMDQLHRFRQYEIDNPHITTRYYPEQGICGNDHNHEPISGRKTSFFYKGFSLEDGKLYVLIELILPEFSRTLKFDVTVDHYKAYVSQFKFWDNLFDANVEAEKKRREELEFARYKSLKAKYEPD